MENNQAKVKKPMTRTEKKRILALVIEASENSPAFIEELKKIVESLEAKNKALIFRNDDFYSNPR